MDKKEATIASPMLKNLHQSKFSSEVSPQTHVNLNPESETVTNKNTESPLRRLSTVKPTSAITFSRKSVGNNMRDEGSNKLTSLKIQNTKKQITISETTSVLSSDSSLAADLSSEDAKAEEQLQK